MRSLEAAAPARRGSTPFLSVLPDADGRFFDESACVAAGASLRERYAAASPFPHVVVDDFLPAPLVERLLADFPPREMARVVRMETAEYHKRGYRPDDLGARECRSLFYAFNSRPFLAFLESLSGIDGLLPDPYFDGGGYHEIAPGGKLNVHADFNLHTKLNLRRRLNVLVYLNKDWDPAYGGCLELWDRRMTARVVSVAPVFNRCVVFNTDEDSYHGHPEPLTCPAGRSRKSVALYYYTASATIRDELAERTTRFRRRPGTRDDVGAANRVRELVRDVTPPIMMRTLSRLRRAVVRADGRQPVAPRTARSDR